MSSKQTGIKMVRIPVNVTDQSFSLGPNMIPMSLSAKQQLLPTPLVQAIPRTNNPGNAAMSTKNLVRMFPKKTECSMLYITENASQNKRRKIIAQKTHVPSSSSTKSPMVGPRVIGPPLVRAPVVQSQALRPPAVQPVVVIGPHTKLSTMGEPVAGPAQPFIYPWRKKNTSGKSSKEQHGVDAMQHRLNERRRHKETNNLIDKCVSSIPLKVDPKETKVMHIQRVVAYFCFLEKKIGELCRELQLDPKLYQVSNVLDHVRMAGSVCSQVQNLDLKDFVPVELLNAYLNLLGSDTVKLKVSEGRDKSADEEDGMDSMDEVFEVLEGLSCEKEELDTVEVEINQGVNRKRKLLTSKDRRPSAAESAAACEMISNEVVYFPASHQPAQSVSSSSSSATSQNITTLHMSDIELLSNDELERLVLATEMEIGLNEVVSKNSPWSDDADFHQVPKM